MVSIMLVVPMTFKEDYWNTNKVKVRDSQKSICQ